MDTITLKEIERKLEKLEASVECSNLMARYQLVHTASDQEASKEMFAMTMPDVRLEAGVNILIGPEHVARSFDNLAIMESDMTGRVYKHDLLNPLIVVADDARTAVGMWNTFGLESGVDEDGQPASYWCWTQYKVDFIKENGKWKFWHFRMIPQIQTPYTGKGWTDIPHYNFFPNVLKYLGFDTIPPITPDCKKRSEPFNLKNTDHNLIDLLPKIPEPYATWSDEMGEIENLLK